MLSQPRVRSTCEEESYEIPAQTDGGFVRSWKLNLRLTTRAEDNHAAPNLEMIHSHVLLHVVHTYSVADENDYQFIEYVTYTKGTSIQV